MNCSISKGQHVIIKWWVYAACDGSFIFLNWNVIVLKYFMVFHVEFIFLPHFVLWSMVLLWLWYLSLHFYPPFKKKSCVICIVDDYFLILYHWSCWVNLSSFFGFSNFVASVKIFFQCIFVNILTIWMFLILFSFWIS